MEKQQEDVKLNETPARFENTWSYISHQSYKVN